MTTLDMRRVGERVGRYRRAAGLSAQALADQAGAGLTRSIVANMEAGRRGDIGVSQLVAIALVLKVPLVALIVDLEAPDAWFDESAGLRNLDALEVLEGWFGADLERSETPGDRARNLLWWLEQYAADLELAEDWDLSQTAVDADTAAAFRGIALVVTHLAERGVALERVDVEAMRRRVRAAIPRPRSE